MYTLTPTTGLVPSSIARKRSASFPTSRSFMYPRASTEPPMSRTRPNSSHASVAIRSTRSATTRDPSRRSSYSSRSVSSARICCARSDHCWSQARGRPSASFHAGSWMARARSSRDSVTPSISSRIRYTLFSGCWAVRPSEFTCTPYRNRRRSGSSTPYRSTQIRSHKRAKTRILHASSTNRIPALQKKAMRPTSLGNSPSGTCPVALTVSRTQTALASVNATSRTGSAPASCRWYEQTLMGFHRGSSRRVQTMRSDVSRSEGSGGKMCVPLDRNSFRMSFWVVPASDERESPCSSATVT